MSSQQLEQLALEFNPPIDLDIILKDQTGVSREGKSAMGSVVPREAFFLQKSRKAGFFYRMAWLLGEKCYFCGN